MRFPRSGKNFRTREIAISVSIGLRSGYSPEAFSRRLKAPWKNRNACLRAPEIGSHRLPMAACVRRSVGIPICRMPGRIDVLSVVPRDLFPVSVKAPRAPPFRTTHNAATPCRGGVSGCPHRWVIAAKRKGPGNPGLCHLSHLPYCISARCDRLPGPCAGLP